MRTHSGGRGGHDDQVLDQGAQLTQAAGVWDQYEGAAADEADDASTEDGSKRARRVLSSAHAFICLPCRKLKVRALSCWDGASVGSDSGCGRPMAGGGCRIGRRLARFLARVRFQPKFGPKWRDIGL